MHWLPAAHRTHLTHLTHRTRAPPPFAIQELPTSGWSSADVGELLSQAFVYMSLYHNAPNHLRVTQATWVRVRADPSPNPSPSPSPNPNPNPNP